MSADMATTELDVPGQFKIVYSYNAANGYTQLCITLRDRPDDEPTVIVDGVRGDVHVGVYDAEPHPVRIDRNGAAHGGEGTAGERP